MFGHRQFQPVIDLIIELAEDCAKEPWDLGAGGPWRALWPPSKRGLEADLRAAYAEPLKQARHEKVDAVKTRAKAAVRRRRRGATRRWSASSSRSSRPTSSAARSWTPAAASTAATCKTVRPIEAMVGVLPRVHGSALFTRGETQALVRGDARHRPGRADDRRARGRQRASTTCSTTTSRPTRSARPAAWARPGRREIGHGKLAWRATRPLLPAKEAFPYTIRVVSEITESNGSLVDGDRLRHLAGADGCGRAAAALRWPASPWA